ncbi:MAG: hypothetical protein ACI3WQ_04575 [Faecousia sp.]
MKRDRLIFEPISRTPPKKLLGLLKIEESDCPKPDTPGSIQFWTDLRGDDCTILCSRKIQFWIVANFGGISSSGIVWLMPVGTKMQILQKSANKKRTTSAIEMIPFPVMCYCQVHSIMEESEMQMVTLVFTDRHREQHTDESAERLCKDLEISGRIVDALTPDRVLQDRLRHLMDGE